MGLYHLNCRFWEAIILKHLCKGSVYPIHNYITILIVLYFTQVVTCISLSLSNSQMDGLKSIHHIQFQEFVIALIQILK